MAASSSSPMPHSNAKPLNPEAEPFAVRSSPSIEPPKMAPRFLPHLPHQIYNCRTAVCIPAPPPPPPPPPFMPLLGWPSYGYIYHPQSVNYLQCQSLTISRCDVSSKMGLPYISDFDGRVSEDRGLMEKKMVIGKGLRGMVSRTAKSKMKVFRWAEKKEGHDGKHGEERAVFPFSSPPVDGFSTATIMIKNIPNQFK